MADTTRRRKRGTSVPRSVTKKPATDEVGGGHDSEAEKQPEQHASEPVTPEGAQLEGDAKEASQLTAERVAADAGEEMAPEEEEPEVALDQETAHSEQNGPMAIGVAQQDAAPTLAAPNGETFVELLMSSPSFRARVIAKLIQRLG